VPPRSSSMVPCTSIRNYGTLVRRQASFFGRPRQRIKFPHLQCPALASSILLTFALGNQLIESFSSVRCDDLSGAVGRFVVAQAVTPIIQRICQNRVSVSPVLAAKAELSTSTLWAPLIRRCLHETAYARAGEGSNAITLPVGPTSFEAKSV